MRLHTPKKRKGITILEVIVAIFIITIISASATSFVIIANKIEQKNVNGVEVSIISENAVELFRFSDTQEEFLALLNKTNDFTIKNDTIVLENQNYMVVIRADFTLNTLIIVALDSGGSQIYNLSYGN